MRFVILHQAGTSSEAGTVPPLSRDITLHEHAPLKADATGTRIRFTHAGPAAEPCVGPGRIAGLSIVEAESRQAAAAWLRDAADCAQAGFEIRETGCAGGLAGVDPLATATRPRFLILVKADADTEAEAPSDPAKLAAMARRNDEGVRDGLLLAADGLRSTARGTRVRVGGGKTSMRDGPFAETKELVAGFWLLQADSMDEAIAWVRRYPFAQARPEVEIHPVDG
ncbi:YciI family protein [Variovorax sp. RA8]|uniref:YciI family protein n=1 Tax=Variovorax sp. (strain JCM 16519 / RA8) TaxID=662548 RepID=UPI001315F6CA|nr:YciI family protein [Variovorax sp. RA8]VTU24643.1 YCII-related domain protein [Variovorax sp. RA8]